MVYRSWAVLALQSLWPATEDRAEAEPVTAYLVAEVAEPLRTTATPPLKRKCAEQGRPPSSVCGFRRLHLCNLAARAAASLRGAAETANAAVSRHMDIQRFPACDILVACADLCRPLAATET